MLKIPFTVVAGLALATAGLAGAANAATPTVTTPPVISLTTGSTGTIALTGGKLCVAAAKNSAKVVLASCNIKDVAQQWTPVEDGSLRVHGIGGSCLATDGKNNAVVGGCSTPLLPRGDYTIFNGTRCLTAPKAVKGTQLTWGTCSASASKHFTVPSSHYASSALSYRPDSGGGGDNWALDTMTRRASITWQGGTTYVGSVVDSGTFVTVPGNLTPNQSLHPGKTLGDSLVGGLYGSSGYHFTETGHSSTARVPASVRGVGSTGTGDWMKWFFPATSQFGGPGMDNGGPNGWSWSYWGTNNCGKGEHWVDSYAHSGQGASDGDITAPAPGTC